MKGTVLWFDKKRGFGFITDDADPEKSYFVHYTAINSDAKFKCLVEGQKVSFDIGKAKDDRVCALNVAIE